MAWQLWWAWMVLGALLAAAELMVPGFICLGFAIGAVAVALLLWSGLWAVLGLGLGLGGLLLGFALLSALAWALLRRLAPRSPAAVRRWDEDINDTPPR